MIFRRIALAVVVAAVFANAGCKRGKWEKDEEVIGYVGEARRDPFLGYKRLLEEWGWDVNKRRGIAELPGYYETLFISSDTVVTDLAGARIERWVDDGGHLIYCLSGTGRVTGREDEVGDDFYRSELAFADDEDGGPILGRFGIQLGSEDDENDYSGAAFTVRDLVVDQGEEIEVDMGGPYTVKMDGSRWRRNLIGDDPEGAGKFLSFPHGDGRLSVLTDAGSLRNTEIADLDHARFGIQLMGLGSGGDIWFVTEPDRSIWPMIWNRGWMIVIALIVLIVFWLWKNLARFGPVSDLDNEGLGAMQRERFRDHLLTGGRFLWRKKRAARLLEAVRRSVLTRYQQKLGDDGGADIVDVLAERCGLPSERVDRGLFEQSITDGSTMVAIVRDLQLIESKL